jgi:hypothetical protein
LLNTLEQRKGANNPAQIAQYEGAAGERMLSKRFADLTGSPVCGMFSGIIVSDFGVCGYLIGE